MFIFWSVIFLMVVYLVIDCMRDKKAKLSTKIWYVIGCTFMWGFITLFVLVVAGLFVVSTKSEYQGNINIVSFKDNQAYVVSRYGGVDQSDRYYYLYNDSEGFTKTGWTSAYNSRVIESNEHPHIKVYDSVFTGDNIFQKDFVNLFNWLFRSPSTSPVDVPNRYDFYIPAGSIKQEFNLDLE